MISYKPQYSKPMKIFLDTADFDEIAFRYSTGLIDGVTTNPTLIKKSGDDPVEAIKRIAEAFPKMESISAEVVADNAADMVNQAKAFVDLPNVTIKVPCTIQGLIACRDLSLIYDKTVNVTLVFSPSQAILASKAGATYVSPFVGRVDDNSFNGIGLVRDISQIYREHMVRTQTLAASIRSVGQVAESFAVGAEVVTMPPAIFDKMYNHILTDKGLELFQKDWDSVTKG